MDDRYAALALGYLKGISYRKIHDLMRSGYRPADICSNCASGPGVTTSPGDLYRQQRSSVDRRVHAALATLDQLDIQLLCWGDPDYPELLAEIDDPPPFLYLRGAPTVLHLPQVALVGARSASRPGRRDAYNLAYQLAEGGLAITSGLALGIDAAAHRGALDAGGATLAIAGTGVDLVYPYRHQDLAEQILESGGVLVSEFPPGTPPRREHFPQRNRIVSGLSRGVVVVEAKAGSGSLITAEFALEQGRAVCALPGGPSDPLKKGCHQLIREGAILVESAADIVEACASLLVQPPCNEDARVLRQKKTKPSLVLELLGSAPLSFDELLHESGWSAAELAAELGKLEVRGLIYRSPEGIRRN